MIASRRGVWILAAIAAVLAIWVAVDLSSTTAPVNRALVPGFDPARVTRLVWPDVEAIRSKRPDMEIYVYDEAGHGFNCDERGSYDKGSADIALTRTRDFLAKHMKK